MIRFFSGITRTDASASYSAVPAGPFPSNDLTAFGIFLPEKYGAALTYDATVDDTTFVQAAVNAAGAAKGRVYFSRLYEIKTGPVTVATTCQISGAAGIISANGSTNMMSGLATDSTTLDVLSIGVNGVTCTNFAVYNHTAGTPSAGAGINVTAGGAFATFERVYVSGFYTDMAISAGQYYTLRGCHFYDPVKYGLWMTTTLAAVDTGDQVIDGCVFNVGYTSRTPDAAIRWEGGGGPKITSCKVNGGAGGHGQFSVGFDFAIMDGGATSDIFVTGNSIENVPTAGILVRQAGTTGTLANVNINGNEIGAGTRTYGIQVIATSSGQIDVVNIIGNVFSGITGQGIYLSTVKSATVTGNTIKTSGTPVAAIWLNQGNGVRIGPNTVEGSGFTDALVSLQGANSAGIEYEIPAWVGSGPLVKDNRWNAGATTQQMGTNGHRLTRTLPAVTSTSTWVQLYEAFFPSANGGSITMEVKAQGIAAGAAVPFTIVAKRAVTQPTTGGAATATLIDTDTATQATQVEYQFDTATTSGAVIFSMRLKSGGTATGLTGTVTVSIDGMFRFIYRL